MKLLLVNSAAPSLWGGGEKWFVEAAKWFLKRGHAATLICRPHSKLQLRAVEADVPCEVCAFGGDFDPFAIWHARNLLLRFRPDAVLTNFNKESWQFGLASKFTKTPVVARHGFTVWSAKRHHKLLAARVLSHVIVNAESIRDRYSSLGIVTRGLTVIPNGVESQRQQVGELRRLFEIEADEFLIVAAGRLETQKRFDRVINFAAALKDRFRFHVVLFGEGPLMPELQERSATLGVKNRVHFCGFDPEFAKVVGDADLFLLTSDEEGTPNAALEAMAAGVPVLSNSVGAVPQILSGSLSDFVIAAGDDQTFVTTIEQHLKHPQALARRRGEFQTRALTEYGFERSMRSYEDVLRNVSGTQ